MGAIPPGDCRQLEALCYFGPALRRLVVCHSQARLCGVGVEARDLLLDLGQDRGLAHLAPGDAAAIAAQVAGPRR